MKTHRKRTEQNPRGAGRFPIPESLKRISISVTLHRNSLKHIDELCTRFDPPPSRSKMIDESINYFYKHLG